MKPTNTTTSDQTPAPEAQMTYKERNPNVVGRVPLALFERLQALMKATGQSMGQIIRESLDRALRERQADYDKGWNDGYEQGKSDFSVTYPCCKCGRALHIVSDDARAEVAECMAAQGWGCKKCPPTPLHGSRP